MTSTVSARRTVLVVAHTLVYAQRVRQAVGLVESDPRVHVTYAVAPHPFGRGVRRWLKEDQGVDVIAWEEARQSPFDLALLAGSRGMHELKAPVLRMQHGGGNIKALRPSAGSTANEIEAPSTLTRRYLTHDGQLVPSILALAHRDDLELLARSCPEALDVARVVGDPAYDRVRAALPHRERYRTALGLRSWERLLLVSSTWGGASSFGWCHTLLPKLHRELPAHTRIVLLLHPNIHAAYGGPRKLRRWLGDALGERVALAPPETAWEGLLVAADWVIGDHGSVTSYAALTRRPVLLGRFTGGGVVTGSTAATLRRAAPALSEARPLTEQLGHARDAYDADAHLRVARQLTSEPGRFHTLMRGVIYERLGLDEPPFATAMFPAPAPAPLATWAGSGRAASVRGARGGRDTLPTGRLSSGTAR
ncbi:hypothetical protein [Streptomyces sedi]|uniref:Uncharacterized protein n=1 Tax=Streptomyces sedi TaxID=555059 RepID=A0A5C4VF71_9ACTN|nr:hypothetical protein [Streptomyces sedi]TNM34471.1 hypothetical protein FH715_02035 [Streptomyces sedi]